MVNPLSMAAMVFTALVALLLPIVLVVVLYIKKRISLLAVLVGALVFVVFQLLTRIPLLNMLATTPFYQAMSQNLLALALFLGLTAGLFESVGRYVAFRFFLKSRLQIKNGVAYGLGHGGIEAILLVGVAYLNNLVVSVMINTGQFQAVAPTLGARAEAVRTALTDTSATLFLVPGLERMLTLIIQVALSLVVLFAVRDRKPLYLLYAILLHALVDAPLVLLSSLPNPILWSELWVFLMALAGAVFILRVWKKYETPGAPEEQPEPQFQPAG